MEYSVQSNNVRLRIINWTNLIEHKPHQSTFIQFCPAVGKRIVLGAVSLGYEARNVEAAEFLDTSSLEDEDTALRRNVWIGSPIDSASYLESAAKTCFVWRFPDFARLSFW